MKNKLKQVKKYLSDKYYIEDWEWIINTSFLLNSCAYYVGGVNIHIMWNLVLEHLYLDNIDRFDELKIKKILKGSGVVLMIDNEREDYE